MATRTYTIGTASRDYSSINTWKTDLNDVGTYPTNAYDTGDDAVGELYDDSDYTDNCLIVNIGALSSILLTVYSADRHTGYRDTGMRLLANADRDRIQLNSVSTVPITIEWLEIDMNGFSERYGALSLFAWGSGTLATLQNCIVHDGVANGANNYGIYHRREKYDIFNCIAYDFQSTAELVGAYKYIAAPSSASRIYNCTGHNAHASTDNDAYMFNGGNDTDLDIRNCIGMDSDLANFVNISATGRDYNCSEDATAAGANSLINKTPGNQFTSLVGGSEDYRLKAGADVIDEGYDFGSVANIDIQGRDRDAEGDTWDMGADEYVAAPVGLPGNSLMLMGLGI